MGYGPYLDRVPARAGQCRHASDNRVELDRARHALSLAAAGRQVAVVSGGDPGVFAMAAAVFEAVETGDPAWRGLDIRVEPGVTAMLAAAAEVGAPLGGDFCAISLSDNLKAWTHGRAPPEGRRRGRLRDRALQSRLQGAADTSSARRSSCCARSRAADTPVLFVRAAGTADAEVDRRRRSAPPIRRAPTCAPW